MSTVTILQPQAQSNNLTTASSSPSKATCEQCGADVSYAAASAAAEDAQRRISELEAQVRILTGKATAAVDKLADYEDQLHQLRSTNSANNASGTSSERPSPHLAPVAPHLSRSASADPSTKPLHTTNGTPEPTQSNSSTKSRLPSRLQNLLRPPSAPATQTTFPASAGQPPIPPTPNIHATDSPENLKTLLHNESQLRASLESQLNHTQSELEELSAQLFSEANEMVAQERKARKKLEDRVEVLEKRDKDKAERLETLSKRVGRIERVRGLLGEK